jgi:hypothetical protein
MRPHRMPSRLESENRMKQDGTDDSLDLAGIISELRSMEKRIAAIILILERSQPRTSEPETRPHSFAAPQTQRAQTSATPAPGIRNKSQCRRVRR